ncbi:MAG: phospho-N-acetylmuramoyl-pentapeptide-transferase [Nitrospirae bacterium CG_4_10_14_0_8_um_filter_41_23]|nr:phospho-N-acetylmuramoyl-pentapeptide-transferase [Nitrospirota bacterium]OIP58807.1 MAG: phospho-N-acetylmuramoyl-pentapeptide-transferase [Nitrospirae bacterium CG2_30_41_42]PIQ95086.1 MAG: phospho-N-acetylmuramoyl-pentapeptide-transferase [Nitrospirae bacterium CG11_big_fil_rev_8_21_14_0_20_41_14]PIV41646.1 MAG: phospho-N-acetylmuramoyl-pentapeptide-transferase [Nitrospirae bacterium CG02_land_8_20_14_3_00_41_53]PIW86694.1 MAG: phospho-N-acetylmuramoyl-pentapeptide-transferase [Nitrospira
MLYSLLYSLHDWFSPLNVFRYITFRTSLAVLTAMIFALILGPWIISRLKGLSMTQQIRDDGPRTHMGKAGTPTMGGLLIILCILLAVFMWGDLKNLYVWVMIVSLVGFGCIGLFDDYLKIIMKNHKGLRAYQKFGSQVILALLIGIFLYMNPKDPYADVLSIPFFKKWLFDFGWLYIPFSVIVIVGSSNAVNLTDGIDGLAIGLVAVAVLASGVLVYISGHKGLAQYLQVLYLSGTGELTVFCGAMFGASLGFLWYNSYPADVFMGDVGSLGLGGSLGTLAVITKHEIVLAIVGGIFVIETISVMLQVASFKLTGKRVFKMAPIHHHFELKGWPEPKVIIRFWIIGIMLALLSLATLKVR